MSRVIGATLVVPLGDDLAEVHSLAVSDAARGRGVGRRVVEALAAEARERQLTRTFALTPQVDFFARLGFQVADKGIFPQKVWLDCLQCPKRHACDETAMVLGL